MPRISHVLAAAALSLAGAAIASAQTGAPAPATNIVTRVVRASLNGIVLTDAEKTSLASVSKTVAPTFKTLADETKPVVASFRKARVAHDTAAARAARQKLVTLRRSGATALRKTLVDIRAVLTPEHQSHFDANGVRVRRAIRRWVQNPIPPRAADKL